jgi:hypothetical protein
MTATASKDSISSAWISFLDTHSRQRVFIFNLWNFTTASGIDDFVKSLQRNNITPVVITHLAAVANLADLMSADRYPTNLPTFNVEPGSISVGELVNLARGRVIVGSVSDLDLEDTFLSAATLSRGGAAFVYADIVHPTSPKASTTDVTFIRHLSEVARNARFQQSLQVQQ